MSTGTVIIQKALQRIGAHSVVMPSSPESIDDGLFRLNTMIEVWLSRGIDVGAVPIPTAGTELNETADSRAAIIDSLALELAASFDNGKVVVSQDLKNSAASNFETIKNLYQKVVIPIKVLSTTVPPGQGNQLRRKRTTTLST